jgi:hypothetical protein
MIMYKCSELLPFRIKKIGTKVAYWSDTGISGFAAYCKSRSMFISIVWEFYFPDTRRGEALRGRCNLVELSFNNVPNIIHGFVQALRNNNRLCTPAITNTVISDAH